MKRLWIAIICIGLLSAFGNHQLKPKASSATIEVLPLHTSYVKQSNAIETMMYESKNQEFNLKYHVNRNNVYVECYIPNFSFKNSTNPNIGGYINLIVDQKKIDKISTAAFVVKGLSAGNHNIKLEIIHNSNKNNFSEQFQVHIQ